jgi:type IX secretion system PorP/SprF family membrane protein
MRKNLLFVSALCLFSVSNLNAQQQKLLTHFMFDKMSINPGATGMGILDGICGTAIYRNQWDRVVGAPNSAIFNAEANLSRYFPSAVGISFYHDAIGHSRQNNVTLNYSYHLPLGNGNLGMGLGLGLVSYGFNPSWVTPDFNPNDPLLPPAMSEANFDANFGLYYQSDDNWYAGLSAVHLPGSELQQLNFETVRHYYLMGGYKMVDAFDVDRLDLEYNVLMRTDMIKASADLNVRAIWDKLFYGGLTFRPYDALGIMGGMQLPNNFMFGYSYDITVNKLASISRGSHELFVRYCYFLPPPPVTKSRNPRYL